MTLVANAVAPGLLDRYLARTGIDSQQATAPCDPDQAENLWTPADLTRDFGTHGRFDEQAKTRSTQVWASQHHALLAALSGGAFVSVPVRSHGSSEAALSDAVSSNAQSSPSLSSGMITDP